MGAQPCPSLLLWGLTATLPVSKAWGGGNMACLKQVTELFSGDKKSGWEGGGVCVSLCVPVHYSLFFVLPEGEHNSHTHLHGANTSQGKGRSQGDTDRRLKRALIGGDQRAQSTHFNVTAPLPGEQGQLQAGCPEWQAPAT